MTIEQIIKHPAVSRVYSNSEKIESLTDNVALQALCRLRRMRREAKAAIQNARADVASVGFSDSPARMPAMSREAKYLTLAWNNCAMLPIDLSTLLLDELQRRNLA